MNEKKNETKKSDTKRDSVSLEKGKDSKQTSTKKPNDKGKRFSDAGKGDRSRIGISLDEWEVKWEKIFGKSKQKSRGKSDEKNS